MKRGLVFWLTGLSGAGKTTLARSAALDLTAMGRAVLTLDGDELRPVLSGNLGFGREDVVKNNRRVATYCQSRRGEADILLVSIISPLAEGRAITRRLLAPGFFEIHVDADLSVVMARDPKGLYARAKAGEIPDMIGFAESSPYEIPAVADLVLSTNRQPPEHSTETLVRFILSKLDDTH